MLAVAIGRAGLSVPGVDGASAGTPHAQSQVQPQIQGQAQDQTAGQALPSSIHGVVASKDGELYEGVRVTLTVTGANALPARLQETDSGGAFNFAGVPAGPFTLAISSDGFATQTISGVLHAGEEYDAQTIVLPVTRATSEVRCDGVAAGHCGGAVPRRSATARAGRDSEFLRCLRAGRASADDPTKIQSGLEVVGGPVHVAGRLAPSPALSRPTTHTADTGRVRRGTPSAMARALRTALSAR